MFRIKKKSYLQFFPVNVFFQKNNVDKKVFIFIFFESIKKIQKEINFFQKPVFLIHF